MHQDLSGKVAVVTGAAGGIGTAICRAYAAAGARLVCVDMDHERGSALADALRRDGAEALFVAADVTDPAQVARYVETAVRAFGGIDAFANNAGIEGEVRATVDYPLDVFDRVMAINVRGVFLGLKYVLPVMQRQRSGAVVNTGSTGSHIAAPGVSAYVASKHAVLGLTRSAALEVARDGVRVNAVCPGSTDTRMLASLATQRSGADLPAIDLGTPNGRIATPEQVAAAVIFLSSELAAHIVGQSIVIDGGRLAM